MRLKIDKDKNTFSIEGTEKIGSIDSIDDVYNLLLDTEIDNVDENLKDKFPHKNKKILHQTDCDKCNEFPHLKFYRLKHRINFTGGSKSDWERCPSEVDEE